MFFKWQKKLQVLKMVLSVVLTFRKGIEYVFDFDEVVSGF